jgi:hypothetical protein
MTSPTASLSSAPLLPPRPQCTLLSARI